MEDYAAKMALKPETALREYVASYAQYREEAVLAALDELRHRGQPAPEEATLRPQLEATVQQAQAVAAAQAASEAEAAELPTLYSPAGIVILSATISVVAGAVLLALNLYKLKRGRAIVGLVTFVVLYLLMEAFLLRWLVAQHLFTPLVAFFIDLPIIMVYIWWFWPRYIGTSEFQPRNWLLPLAACFVLKLGLAYLLMKNPATAQLMQQQLEQMQQR